MAQSHHCTAIDRIPATTAYPSITLNVTGPLLRQSRVVYIYMLAFHQYQIDTKFKYTIISMFNTYIKRLDNLSN